MSGQTPAVTKRQVWNAYRRCTAFCTGTGRDLDALAIFDTDLPGNLTAIWKHVSLGSPMAAADPPEAAIIADRIARMIVTAAREPTTPRTATTSAYALQGGSRLIGEVEMERARTLVSRCEEAEPATVTHEYGAKRALLFEDVLVWPHLGLAGDASERIISDTCGSEKRLSRMIEEDAFVVDRTIHASGTCTAIEYGFWNNHYHWLVDVLPRIDALYRAEVEDWRPLTLYVRDTADPRRRRVCPERLSLLQRLAPPGVRVEEAPPGARLRVDRYVHLPCLAEDHCAWVPMQYVERFRQAADDCFPPDAIEPGAIEPSAIEPGAIEPGGERIYISRRLTLQRRVLNEPELEAALALDGFRSHTLESMPLAEQAALFRRARIVVAPHGAGLTNLLFTAPRCRVLELFPGPAANHYRWLAHALGHDYANLPGTTAKRHADFTVDVPAVRRRLDRWL